MNGSPADSCILDWCEDEVHAWLSTLGYSQYGHHIKEHKITGDILCVLDADGLKALGVSSAGQRLRILKSIYQLKLAHNIPIDPEHYVPPTTQELPKQTQALLPEELRRTLADQSSRLIALEKQNKDLKTNLRHLWEAFNQLQNYVHESEDSNMPSQPTRPSKYAPSPRPPKSSIWSDLGEGTPRFMNDEVTYIAETPFFSTLGYESSAELPPFATPPLSINKHQINLDNLKRFKVSIEDPTWKVLPAALQRYKISREKWSNYAMFISYESAGDRKERRFSSEDKPLDLFQKLRDARKDPVCLLKLVKKPMRTRSRQGNLKLPLRSPATVAVKEDTI